MKCATVKMEGAPESICTAAIAFTEEPAACSATSLEPLTSPCNAATCISIGTGPQLGKTPVSQLHITEASLRAIARVLLCTDVAKAESRQVCHEHTRASHHFCETAVVEEEAAQGAVLAACDDSSDSVRCWGSQ